MPYGIFLYLLYKIKTMKNFLILAGLAVFVVSCGTQKKAAVASTPAEASC